MVFSGFLMFFEVFYVVRDLSSCFLIVFLKCYLKVLGCFFCFFKQFGVVFNEGFFLWFLMVF